MTPDNVERERSEDLEYQPEGEFSAADADAGSSPDGVLIPPDDPQVLDDYGTTAAEARADEPLSSRLAREQPETSEDSMGESQGGILPGQLVEPGSEGVDSVDTTPESIARDAGAPGGVLSAEEAALHLEE